MILIHWPEDDLSPRGGPAGYLYNLRNGLRQVSDTNVDFLPPKGAAIRLKIKHILPTRINEIWRIHRLIKLISEVADAPVDYSQYSIIHFHETADLYIHRNELESFNGKVLLTSHCPCAPHKEVYNSLKPRDYIRNKDALASLERIDEYAFTRADNILFPCDEAEEPYFHTWPQYSEIREESRILYVPTGIAPCVAREGRERLRARLGIPENAFVVTYVGRHNEVKGYADFLAAGPTLLADDMTWVLVAGKEEPLRGLDHPRWLELGWTDDPHSIIAAADVFVLPNRETYFDLVLLETLSLGKIAIVSDTGGNRYFKRYSTLGVFYFDTVESLVQRVREVSSMSLEDRKRFGQANLSIYERYFTCTAFAQRYLNAVASILED